MEGKRKFRCASCGYEFETEERQPESKCPKCRSRALILVEGEGLGKKGGCAPSG